MRPVRSPSLPAAFAFRVLRPRVNEENRTPCWVGHDHPPLHPAPSTMWGRCAPKCIREVLTLRLPRCERGALPLSYGCVECVLAAGLEPAQSGSKSRARPVGRHQRLVPLSGRRRHRLTPGRDDLVDTGRFGSSTSGVSCRRSASELCVSVGVMGGFDPPPRAFQARALPTELHDHGAGPGTRTRINWVTKPAPIPSGPAGTLEWL